MPKKRERVRGVAARVERAVLGRAIGRVDRGLDRGGNRFRGMPRAACAACYRKREESETQRSRSSVVATHG
jgi:hypothetical protein